MQILELLKQEIKQRETASREIRKLIQGSSGMERHQHWLEKRHHGDSTRCLLMLYAIVRGKTRHTMERKRQTENGVLEYERWYLSRSLESLAKKHNLPYALVDIQSWLWAAAPEQEVAA